MSTIRLLDIPKLLLEKYDNPTLENLFPVPSNQKTNAYLKEIADICKIHKNITFHVARHTFATTIALSHGMPVESLAKCWDIRISRPHKSMQKSQTIN